MITRQSIQWNLQGRKARDGHETYGEGQQLKRKRSRASPGTSLIVRSAQTRVRWRMIVDWLASQVS